MVETNQSRSRVTVEKGPLVMHDTIAGRRLSKSSSDVTTVQVVVEGEVLSSETVAPFNKTLWKVTGFEIPRRKYVERVQKAVSNAKTLKNSLSNGGTIVKYEI